MVYNDSGMNLDLEVTACKLVRRGQCPLTGVFSEVLAGFVGCRFSHAHLLRKGVGFCYRVVLKPGPVDKLYCVCVSCKPNVRRRMVDDMVAVTATLKTLLRSAGITEFVKPTNEEFMLSLSPGITTAVQKRVYTLTGGLCVL